MASSNQYSRGLKFSLASLILLFFIAAITVESRPVSLTAPLLPEYSGASKSNIKKNSDLVGTSIAYVASRGRFTFGFYVVAAVNEDPENIAQVALFYTGKEKKIIAKLNLTESGFYTYKGVVNQTVGRDIHHESTSVGVWLKDKKDDTKSDLVIAGTLANNRTTFISYLLSRSVTTKPTGTKKNDGFAVVHASLNANGSAYLVTGALNVDIDDKIVSVQLNGPSPSGSDNANVSLALTVKKLDKAARLFQVEVSSTVFYWMSNHLFYITVNTKKNPTGAIRGQLISTTNPRLRVPVFPNGAQSIRRGNVITVLDDGSSIIGNLSFALSAGGARLSNQTIGLIQDRVAYFISNSSNNFDNLFRFPLPVTLLNKYLVRGAFLVFTAAAEVVDDSKWNLGLYNAVKGQVAKGTYPIPGNGNMTYNSAVADLSPSDLQKALTAGGTYISLTASGVTNPLFVDRFYVTYSVCSATANNLVRSIFFAGSDAAEDPDDE